MSLLRALGLGRDPHIEWMVEAFHAEPKKIVVNRLYEGSPKHQLWEGQAQGVPLTFYTSAGNKYRGGAGVYLGDAGPQFMEGISDYRCYFWRPAERPGLSIDDSRWISAAQRAANEPDCSSLPEEAFEAGVAVGPFGMVLDCPLDPRPLFPHLSTLRDLLLRLSDAVDTVYIHAGGIGIGFAIDRLTREKLVADVEVGTEILRLTVPG
jgi:hypothetical protein